MPKVLYTIGSLGLGGAESQMVLLMRKLMQRGWHCELFALEARGPLRTALEADGVVIHDGGYDSGAKRLLKTCMLVRALLRLCGLAHRMRPNVLHAFLPLTNFLGAIAGRLTRVELVITSRRALGTHQDRYPLWKPFDRLSNRLSNYVTVNSQAVLDDTVARDRINPSKVLIISNGIEVERFKRAAPVREAMRQSLGLKADEIGIVAVGNLIPYKGHVDLLHALAQVVGRAGIRVFVVGEDRGLGASLSSLADRLAVSTQVVFLGRREDVPEILAAMDIFVTASHEEGFSNALLEAMASGLPIVATDVGGNREALREGSLGILVPPRDPAAMAAAIDQLVCDHRMRLNVGQQAAEYVRTRYAAAAMVSAYEGLYRRRGCNVG